MASTKTLCVALFALAMLTAACGGDASGNQNPHGSANGGQQSHGQGGRKEEQERKDKEDKPEPTKSPAREGNVVRARVSGGRVRGVGDTVDVAVGEELTILVRSDAADEVHVHGYNLFDDVGPGQQAEIELTADIPGVFEVELEDAHLLLFELQVQ